MNTDRFLTRVFDKQEGKMYYIGDSVPDNCYSKFVGKYHTNFTLIAINEYGLCVGAYIKDTAAQIQIFNVAFGDRYVPMQCEGSHDKNKKLIYESDICKDRKSNLFIMSYSSIRMLVFQSIKSENDLLTPMEIIGNRWENPKFWKEKTK